MSNPDKFKEIPVLTVWKNNSILKNFFLINTTTNNTNNDNQEDDNRVFEEVLVVGRHPDCDIRVEHPSISRFHLKIHSLSSNKLLFVTDLSSVHGTWVSGERIEPNIKTMVKEGEHLKIGGSSRIYKLHWIPLSQAYDVAKPFVPPFDSTDLQEDDDEIVEDELSVELEELKDVDNISDDIPKGLVTPNLCGDEQTFAENILPQSPPLQLHKHVLVKDEATEVAVLEPQCLDAISRELDRKQMLQALPSHNEDFENDDGQSIDSILEGLVPCLSGDMSNELEQKDSFENEDVESVDSILEGLVPLFMGENWEWVGLEDNYLPCPTEDYPQTSADDETAVLKTFDTLLLDENSELLAPLMPENLDNITVEGGQGVPGAWSFWCGSHVAPSSPATVESQLNTECQLLVHPISEGSDTLVFDENSEMLAQIVTPSAPSMPVDMKFSTVGNMDGIPAEESREFSPEILSEDIHDNAWSFWRCTPAASPSPAIVGNLENSECHRPGVSAGSDLNSSAKEHRENGLWSFWSGKMGVESECSVCSDAEPFSEPGNKSLTTGYFSSTLGSLKSEEDMPPDAEPYSESVCSTFSDAEHDSESALSLGGERSLSDAESFSESEKESCGDCYYQSSYSLSSVKARLGSPLRSSDLNPLDSIWSRRWETASMIEEKKNIADEQSVEHEPISRVLFHENNDQEDEQGFTLGKENFTPISHKHKSVRKFGVLLEINNSNSGKSPLLKTRTSISNNYCEEDIFTPNKENRKSSVLKEINNSCSGKSPFVKKMSCSPYNRYKGIISPSSNKENYPPRSQQKEKTARRASGNKVQLIKLKERKGDRIPFQSLLADSPHHNANIENRSGSCVSCANVVSCKGKYVRGELRQWNMVVDTATLLNKESRKALQLLEGLKGTQLIIPRIVITELTSLKRQVSFFRRNTEVLSALEWIQDCMLKTGWWIRVQNSTEEGRPVAPTPPASPHSQLCCGMSGSYAFSGCEAFSPTVEDDVLEFALSFRKNNHDGQLVLLSNDVTMKIKAMAEGMICETAEEFRKSLVNPFSSRFRWIDSSPRGRTWSCAEDFVLKEIFYSTSLMMTTEKVRGLKLLLPAEFSTS